MCNNNYPNAVKHSAQPHDAADNEVYAISSRLIIRNREAYLKLAGDAFKSAKDKPSPNH